MSGIERVPGQGPETHAQQSAFARQPEHHHAVPEGGWLSGLRRLGSLTLSELMRPLRRGAAQPGADSGPHRYAAGPPEHPPAIPNPLAAEGFAPLLPLGTQGAGVYAHGEHAYLLDTPEARPVRFAEALAPEPFGGGYFKDAHRLGEHWVATIVRPESGNTMLSLLNEQVDHAEHLHARMEAYHPGFGERFVVPQHGPIAMADERVALVSPLHAGTSSNETFEKAEDLLRSMPALSAEDPGPAAVAAFWAQFTPDEQSQLRLANHNTLEDTALIQAFLAATGTQVEDLHYLFQPDGHIGVVDSLKVRSLEPGESPDLTNTHLLERVARLNLLDAAFAHAATAEAGATAEAPPNPLAAEGYAALVSFGVEGAGFYVKDEQVYLLDTPDERPQRFEDAIGPRLGDADREIGEKDVCRLGEHWALGIYPPSPTPEAALHKAQAQSAMLADLRRIFDGYQQGYGQRFIVPDYGLFQMEDGSAGIVYPLYAAGSKDKAFVKGDLEDASVRSLLNQNTLDDLAEIRRVLQHTQTEIDDLQFLIRPDGHLVIADPLEVHQRNSFAVDGPIRLAGMHRIERIAMENVGG